MRRTNPLVGFGGGLKVAFHPNGQTLAYAHDRVGLGLADLDNGTTLAVLPVPDSHNLTAYEFSPDGRYVAAITVRGAVQLWDLDRLRSALKEIGIDWPAQ